MKTTMKMLAAAVSMGVALTAGAVAQTQPAGSLNELLQRVRSDAREASAENQARLREFQSSTNQQQALRKRRKRTRRKELASARSSGAIKMARRSRRSQRILMSELALPPRPTR